MEDPGGGDQDAAAPCTPEASEPRDPVVCLYLTPAAATVDVAEADSGGLAARVAAIVADLAAEGRVAGRYHAHATACGAIVGLWRAEDADGLLEELPSRLGEPVHATKFGRNKKVVLLQGVPRTIPLQDLSAALAKQGVAVRGVERVRHLVRVELQDATGAHADGLLRDGLDFFGAVRFAAVAERPGPGPWRRDAGAASSAAATGDGAAAGPEQDNVLQCYRCQGFWHVAGNCRHLPRCVRCGEPHTVDFCPRPRHDPVCCHCAGPHHAAFRQCPVRRQLVHAVPLSITMTSAQPPPSHQW